jgi:hypothetical protein
MKERLSNSGVNPPHCTRVGQCIGEEFACDASSSQVHLAGGRNRRLGGIAEFRSEHQSHLSGHRQDDGAMREVVSNLDFTAGEGAET